MKINAHGHILPYKNQFPAFMKNKEVLWMDDNFMYQKNWKRPITDSSFFLEEKLIWMQKNNIDQEVLITLSQLYCNDLEKELAQDVVRFQNDFHAELQQNYSNKFVSGFVVPVAHLDFSLQEIERCVKLLNLRVLCLPTHFLTSRGKWKSIFCDDTQPIFELANQYKLAVEIHPYDAEKMINLADEYWRFHIIWMCAQTADTFHYYLLNDIPNRYPNLRTCFAHGNQYAQINVGRRTQAIKGRPDLFQHKNQQTSIQHKNTYFDTLVHDIYSFELLVKRQSTSQILWGIDDPYPLGEMETVAGCYPGILLDEAISNNIISETDKHKIQNDNIQNWLLRNS